MDFICFCSFLVFAVASSAFYVSKTKTKLNIKNAVEKPRDIAT